MVRSWLGVGWVVLAYLTPGCVRTYRVRPRHLERAQLVEQWTRRRAAIPAHDETGRETFISLPTVLRTRPLPGGWLEIRRADARAPLLLSGGLLVGAAFVVGATFAREWLPFPTRDSKAFFAGLGLGLPGLSMTILGLVLDGPEVSGPTREMPASTSERVRISDTAP